MIRNRSQNWGISVKYEILTAFSLINESQRRNVSNIEMSHEDQERHSIFSFSLFEKRHSIFSYQTVIIFIACLSMNFFQSYI